MNAGIALFPDTTVSCARKAALVANGKSNYDLSIGDSMVMWKLGHLSVPTSTP
jgi:hypothetical protein